MATAPQLTIIGSHGSIEVSMKRGDVVSFGRGSVDLPVEVCKGDVWITAEGNPNDAVIHGGEQGRLKGRHMVAEALTDSVLCIGSTD